MPPTQMVRALALLYEATNGEGWRNHSNWLSGEPCVDGWFGVQCCPRALPVLRGGDECTADGSRATGVRATQGSAACHSGNVTGTALDLATCVVVKVLLPSNNLVGRLEDFHPLMWLPFLQRLDLSGNALAGSLPSAADCLPRLTSLDLTQPRRWDEPGGVTGAIPQWLLGRLFSMTTLRLANNAFDDPTTFEAADAIGQLWQRCQAIGAAECSGVPPFGCSAFNRPGERYEVKLDNLECVRCPTPLEIIGIAGIMMGVVLFLLLCVSGYTYFVRKYPEYGKTHVASVMILISHFQTLTIIGSMELGWPMIIKKILANINLPIAQIPLPCILNDPVLEYILSYTETVIVLLLLVSAWLVARGRRDLDGLREREASAEYFLSILFSLLFTFGLRASVTLFLRYDPDLGRHVISKLFALILPCFLFFLLKRFRRLLQDHRRLVEEEEELISQDTIYSTTQQRIDCRRQTRRAAEAVRYLIERYAEDKTIDLLATDDDQSTKNDLSTAWPRRSQWQLVVWARQLLLLLASFIMDCFVRFAPPQVRLAALSVTTRY